MKTTVAILLAAAVAAAGCKKQSEAPPAEQKPIAQEQPKEPPPPPKEEPKPLTSEELAKWFQGCWGHFNDKKLDEFAKCYADDASVSMPGAPDVTGGPALAELAKMYAAAFPDGKGENELTLINGHQIVSVVLFRGTHGGPLKTPAGDIPPTNKKVGLLFLQKVQVSDKNVVQQEWRFLDTPALLAQLGVSKEKARKPIEQGPPEKPVVIAKDDDNERKNADAHKKVYELFSKHDKAMGDVFADDAVESNMSEAADIKGKKALMGFNEQLWKGFPDIKVEVQEAWGAGDFTFLVGRLTGTNEAPLPAMGIKKKTGKPIDFLFAEVVKWENGKAKMSWPFYDSMQMGMQLGLIQPPAAPAGGAAPAAAAPGEEKKEEGKAEEKKEEKKEHKKEKAK